MASFKSNIEQIIKILNSNNKDKIELIIRISINLIKDIEKNINLENKIEINMIKNTLIELIKKLQNEDYSKIDINYYINFYKTCLDSFEKIK